MIDAALRAVAAYVDDNASSTAWDPHHHLSDEQRFAKGEKIKTVAAELRALAGASETRKVRYAEYEALRDRLYAFGLPLAPEVDQGTVASLREAQGPAQLRQKGWLKPS